MKKWMLAALCLMLIMALAGCGGKKNVTYVDGEYEGKSEPHENLEEDDEAEGNSDGYGVVNLTISGGKITACTFATYDLDGNFKDETYGTEDGEVHNKDFYNKAKKAFVACEAYAKQLVETGDISKVDQISGATYNFYDFQDAVKDALKKAEG